MCLLKGSDAVWQVLKGIFPNLDKKMMSQWRDQGHYLDLGSKNKHPSASELSNWALLKNDLKALMRRYRKRAN